MLKRFQFVSRSPELQGEAFQARWLAALARSGSAPSAARPLRVVACTTVAGIIDTPAHDALSIAWFSDLHALHCFEAWLSQQDVLVDPAATLLVLAEEAVLRGADWLEQRWALGGPKYKHMALARRAMALSPAEFSARWRNRAGRLGGAAQVTIPEAARGHAYVQNHPLAGATQWPYDAINEVYFDDLAGLQARLDFFRQHDAVSVDADLVSQANFLVVQEQILY